MKRFAYLALALAVAVSAHTASAATVQFVDSGTFFDIFYTPSAGEEFAAWDLIATPTVGSLVDPSTADRSDNTQDAGAAVDTFANTVFSSVGAGPASYIFTEYNPGSVFPPVPADPAPSAGGNPASLNWTIFDTATGDGDIPGFSPYHMARVLYVGGGTVDVAFFEGGANPADGGTGSFVYGIPEPGTLALAGLGLIGVFAGRRRK